MAYSPVPYPPPPGVSITNTSPTSIATDATGPSSSTLPSARLATPIIYDGVRVQADRPAPRLGEHPDADWL